MKKDIKDMEHCPYCKRHCSLNNPHCSKGKTLSKKKKEENRKVETSISHVLREDKNRKSLKPKDSKDILLATKESMETDIRLSNLFQKCCDVLHNKKSGKNRKKKKKFLILSLLIEKGELTKPDLEECMNEDSNDFHKLLQKMKKKGYINWSQDDDSKISITDSAKLLWKSNQKESKINDLSFSILENQEKEYLEKILRKLYTNWKQD
jgi:DNA-binding MarR family transcriptional regulator